MTKSPVRGGLGGGGLPFMLLVVLVIYMLGSIAYGITTVKDCDPYGKHWSFVPPHWVCESPQPHTFPN